MFWLCFFFQVRHAFGQMVMIMKYDNGSNPKLGWTLGDLARSLSVSVPFLRLEIKRGRLHATHLGRRVVLLDSEVRRYLADSNGSSVPL